MNALTQVRLTGLQASNTQAWMAALGVLAILDRMGVQAYLQWEEQCPLVHGTTREELVCTLCRYLETGSDILEHLPAGAPGEKTPLDLSAGRVELRGVISQMLAAVDRGKIEQALFERWRNRDDIVSLGWDINALKMAANSGGAHAPDNAPHRGELAAQWLAAESLPITSVGKRSHSYTWVTWAVPLDLGGVRALVLAQSTAWNGERYSALVGRNGQMGYLAPARTTGSQSLTAASRRPSRQR